MLRGLYTAWTGMYTEQKRLDVISNNIANSATVGYKKEGVTSQSFHDMLTIRAKNSPETASNTQIGKMSLGVKIGEVYTNYGQGSVRETGNTFDLAIDGDGFFAIEYTDKNGTVSTRYTRSGQFAVTKDGYIVTTEGQHLLGASGPLQVPTDAADIVIEPDGSVYADREYIDTVQLMDFENYDYLKKFAETMYQPVNGATQKPATGQIVQGYTEQSNVNVVEEMVDLITITRAYEAGQKIIKSYDDLMEESVNTVGRI